jgi:flagellar protein FliO/FliZ
MIRWLPLCLFFFQPLLAAQDKLGVRTGPLGAESLLQTTGGLLLILILILGGAWLFKRFGHMPMGGKGVVKILGGVSVGAREKVVLIEVENVRLLLGVAPGHVRTLHRLPLDERSFRHAMNLTQDAPKKDEPAPQESPQEASQQETSQPPECEPQEVPEK